MRSVTVADLRRHFEQIGLPTKTRFWLDELRWRLYQFKKIGLMYFVERPDQLREDSSIDACLLFAPSGHRWGSDQFAPEPFPVLASVYEWAYRRSRHERVRFLSELAYYKLCYERGTRHAAFEDADQYGLYCAFLERFYDLERPYRGKAVYWVLFGADGVEFFSEQFQIDPQRLAKFQAPPEAWAGRN